MTKIDKFETKLITTIKKYKMLSGGERVLVALSGGKDSVALLHSLHRLSSHLRIELFAFHLNHGIRGEEANADEAFSRDFATKLGIEFLSSYVDVPARLTDTDAGIEALARDIRYKELERIANQLKCHKIATAHTASDNSETVLMTIARNSNAKGIPPVRDNIIRPLICHSTDEVLDYCARQELSFVTDVTNSDDSYTRNFVRHNILPRLYELSPSFDVATHNFANIQRSNSALIELEAKRYYEHNEKPMSLDSLIPLASDIAFYNVLYYVLNKETGTAISYSQFDGIISMLTNGRTGQKIKLSNGSFITRGYNELEFSYPKEEPLDYEFPIKLGRNPIPDSDLVLWLETPTEYIQRKKENELKSLKVNKLTKNILIKYNIINPSLIARSRRFGDSYLCRGITRSVKKFMIDEKIPAHLRSRIPVVCDSEGIVWVAGLGTADRIKNADGDKEAYSLSVDFEKTDC